MDTTPEYDPNALDWWDAVPAHVIDMWELESWLRELSTADLSELI